MAEKPAQASDYKTCPLKIGIAQLVSGDRFKMVDTECDGPRCAWWDAECEECGVLPER